ncbi:transglutaminase domain-containing protein [Methanogenium sp. S4BF]|uniref:transglutaminase domain-containing protein n=1 Tax=Methanogenium sp. S4BF TaxID=1789226 RepID=UPI0024169940|nr:transglutaminase domain-containing protein [Methanogenium sp. S4BF]WFN34392.1 transglutaminase domain-containing protein [Methanogenium sp. S4BF]
MGTPRSVIPLTFAVFILICIAGCTGISGDPAEGSSPKAASSADDLYSQAQAAMKDEQYRTAGMLFEEAYSRYSDSGDAEKALAGRNEMFRANRTILEYPFNKTGAEADLMMKVSGITDAEIDNWLSCHAQKIRSDGETLYYEGISADYLYANYNLLRGTADKSIDFGCLARYAIQNGSPSSLSGGSLPYGNPVYYTGTEKLQIPAEMLPEIGMLKIWYPLPLETESQRNISVVNLSDEEYIVNGPVTTGGIGYVSYEIPAENIDGDLILTADIGYTSYEQIFEVDPDTVEAYDTDDPEYLLYTKSARNIEITDEIQERAAEIVGSETNPYLRAQMIYRYIIDTYPYSHTPHLSLDTIEPKTAESTYLFTTGHGDCGTQSMFFSALCRSLGIPARTTGGYQMLLSDTPGAHFWAEYYIEGYGWIPCDPTVAEIADWLDTSDENRELFKESLSSNLDPARFVIQKDVDAEMVPSFPDGAVVFRLVLQKPAIISEAGEYDLDLLSGDYFSIRLEAGTEI